MLQLKNVPMFEKFYHNGEEFVKVPYHKDEYRNMQNCCGVDSWDYGYIDEDTLVERPE